MDNLYSGGFEAISPQPLQPDNVMQQQQYNNQNDSLQTPPSQSLSQQQQREHFSSNYDDYGIPATPGTFVTSGMNTPPPTIERNQVQQQQQQ